MRLRKEATRSSCLVLFRQSVLQGVAGREPLLHCCGSFFIIIIILPGRRRESRIVGRPVSAAGFEQLGWGGRRLSLLSLVQRCQLYSDCVNVFFQRGTA